ncbi:hypothetical protein AB0R01_14795 [Streptomyces rochei]|uniref:hypothetical protein n=1 Tax=Streptomyces TaxID=1883 RepID=UPI001CBA7F67|nr:hypothetical protein [Streptomyces sp. A144]UAX56801.1 hypothetical protein K5X85_29170 [Streptomyces sp. A144]
MVTERRALLVLEVVFVLVGLVGVALVSVPAALVLGGLLGVVAVERETARHRPVQGRGKGGER